VYIYIHIYIYIYIAYIFSNITFIAFFSMRAKQPRFETRG